MRGKKPKEREKYVLRIEGGTLVEVSREVYLEWYQSRRRERYQRESNQKHGVCSLNELEEKGNISVMSLYVGESEEEIILRNIYREKVRKAIRKLSTEDARLIHMLYFRENTVTETARVYGCSRKAIQNRRKRILDQLCGIMKKEGIQSSNF